MVSQVLRAKLYNTVIRVSLINCKIKIGKRLEQIPFISQAEQ